MRAGTRTPDEPPIETGPSLDAKVPRGASGDGGGGGLQGVIGCLTDRQRLRGPLLHLLRPRADVRMR